MMPTDFIASRAEWISAFAIPALACALIGATEGAVVLNQIGEVNAYILGVVPDPTPSQVFTDFPKQDCMVLEDFAVSSPELKITRVSALFRAQGGYASFQAVQGYSLSIFTTTSLAETSLSGDVASLMVIVGSGASVVPVVDDRGDWEYGLVNLDVDITLQSPGTYWVGVSPESAVTATGQFFLMHSGATGAVTPGNGNAHLANPGEGLGVGALFPLDLDYAYSITAVPEPAALTLWLLGGLACLRRQRQAGHAEHQR